MKFKLEKASCWGSFNGNEIHKKFNPRLEKINERIEGCFIDINSLEDLMEFIKLYGEIVIGEEQILIYDDYIE